MADLCDDLTAGLAWRGRPGEGAPLVCLHGIGSDAASFDALATHLPTAIRTIAWWAPGYGASRPLDVHWPVASDYADALARLVDALGLERFHLLGHSLGTLVGAAFAARHPERVAGLILVSCAQGGGVVRGAVLPPGARARIDDLTRLGPVAFARARAPRLLYRPELDSALLAAVTAAMARVQMPGYGQAVRMLAAGDLAAAVRDLAVPVTVVVGAEDRVTPPEQSRGVWEALPDAARRHFVTVPGIGHALPQQGPGALAEVVAGVMTPQRAGRAGRVETTGKPWMSE